MWCYWIFVKREEIQMKITDNFNKAAYLTESKLYDFVKILYHGYEIVYNKRFPNSLYTPDMYLPEKNILIEHDGNLHYDKPGSVISDIRRDKWFQSLGITTIRVPYFVQLNTVVIKDLFNIDFDFKQVYPHGFVDKKVVLPAVFSEIGVERFLQQLEKFSYIRQDIKDSLEQKIIDLKDERLVITKVIKAYLW